MAKKMFRLNKKSISFGAGPLRANIGTRGVKNSLRVGGQTFSTKTTKVTGGKKASARATNAGSAAPAGPVFVSCRAKKFGYPGVAMVTLGVLTLCGNWKVAAVMLVIGVFLITRGFNADLLIKKQESEGFAADEPVEDEDEAVEVDMVEDSETAPAP